MISIPHFKTYLEHNNYSCGVCACVRVHVDDTNRVLHLWRTLSQIVACLQEKLWCITNIIT